MHMGMSRISHALAKTRREGVGAALARARQVVQHAVYNREEHVWYQLDLNGERPRREFVDGVRLVRAGAPDAHRVEDVGQFEDEAHRRLVLGNDLWLVLDDQDRTLFACWTFRSETPVLAAPGGRLSLPPGTACLEDSVTSPLARGKGIAPAAWTAIADTLATEGFESMVTKVTTDNIPSRKAVEKAGFREIGLMRMTSVVTRRHVALSGSGGVAEALGQSLGA
jgi:GNAT superfamily N-acetyltransferase